AADHDRQRQRVHPVGEADDPMVAWRRRRGHERSLSKDDAVSEDPDDGVAVDYFLSMSPFLSPMSPLSFFLDFFLLLFFMSPESPAGWSAAWANVQEVGSRMAITTKQARINF